MYSNFDASMLGASSNGFVSTETAAFKGKRFDVSAELPVIQVNNVQPYVAINYLVNLQGIFPSYDGGSGGTISIGYVLQFAGNFAIRETAFASGQLLPIAQNTALFSLLGNVYGGDGRTTFALPDLTGDLMIGAGQGAGLENYDIGMSTGSDTFTLTEANLPTSFGGNGESIDNYQSSLAVNYVIHVGVGYGANMIGSVHGFLGTREPNGALFCDGRELLIADYPALFALIGTTYGGDGVNTFNIPDLRGRTIVHAGTGPGLDLVEVGDVLGSATIDLDGTDLPTSVGGDGQPIDNAQPGLGMQILICLNGIFPSRNMEDPGKVNSVEGDFPIIGQMIYYAGTDIPPGWAAANGQLLAINQNTALFSILGTTYGGNGITNFALPDLRGRTIQGAEFGAIGQVGGSEDVTLLASNIPGRTQDGDEFDNTILGSDQADTFRGFDGIDTLTGNGGADFLYGGNGDDIIDGGYDNDLLDGGFGNDTLIGGDGNDYYRLVDAGDVIVENQFGGTDTVQSVMSFARLGDNVENLVLAGWEGSSGFGNDLGNAMTGNSYANTLYGVGGDDTINGRGGKDTIYAGSGHDTVYGGNAGDTIYGGNGDDQLFGENGWDNLFGGSGQDQLDGGDGNDAVYGGGDADQVHGGAGDDEVYGGAGDDTVAGGAGIDTMTGGDGADTFLFESGDLAPAGDRITDFQQGQGDVIDLSAVDAVEGGGDDAFSFIGNGAFTNTAGQLRFDQDSDAGQTIIEGDIDGDGLADFVIYLDGLVDLTATDFSL